MIYIILLIFGTFYYRLQIHHLFGGDSPEYSVVSRTWSIPHPPGYPLYSLLLNLIRILFPFVPEYIRNNLFSIIPTLLTALIIYKTLEMLLKNRTIALAAIIFYLSLFPVWLYAEVPEIFAINNLIISLIIYSVLRYRKSGKNRYRYLCFLLIGLGAAHHQTFIFFLPGLIFLIGNKRWEFVKNGFLRNIAMALLGFSFYIYAPIASFFRPPIDWEYASSLAGFIRLVTRSSYGTFQAYAGSVPNLINQMADLLSACLFLLQDFKPLGIIFIFLGLYFMHKKAGNFFRYVLTTLIIYIFFLFISDFSIDNNFISATYERFMIAFYLILVFPFAFGLKFFFDKYESIVIKYIANTQLKLLTKVVLYVFIAAIIGIGFHESLVKISTVPHINQFDEYAKNLLATPEPQAIVAINGDLSYFTSSYYYTAQKYRSDLKIIFIGLLSRDYYNNYIKSKYPGVIIPSDQNYDVAKKNFILKNSGRYSLFFERPDDVGKGLWVPYGFFWKYYPNNINDKEVDHIVEINDYLWDHLYHIPTLKTNDKNILYLSDLQMNYLNTLYTYTRFLQYHMKISDVKRYLALILSYDSNYLQAKNDLQKLSR